MKKRVIKEGNTRRQVKSGIQKKKITKSVRPSRPPPPGKKMTKK